MGWHPIYKECKTSWKDFSTKQARDYAASQARKIAGYLDHNVGQFKVKATTHFWLLIYTRE